MYRFTIALVLLCSFPTCLSAQTHDHKLLAANGIKEIRAYNRVIREGEAGADSILVFINKLNSKGYSTESMYFDTSWHMPARSVQIYLNDTLQLKTISYKNDQEISGESVYEYDASGNLVRIQHHNLIPPDKFPDTTTTLMVYDSLHRRIALYDGDGKNKRLIFRYEFDGRGNMVKWYIYGSNPKHPPAKLIEYDGQNRPIRFYSLQGGKKKFAGKNVYNELGQRVEQLNISRRVVKKYFGGYDIVWKKKDKMLIRNQYDERGLLIQEDKYKNGQLFSMRLYQYIR